VEFSFLPKKLCKTTLNVFSTLGLVEGQPNQCSVCFRAQTLTFDYRSVPKAHTPSQAKQTKGGVCVSLRASFYSLLPASRPLVVENF
jgi:hypothetical protein